MPLTKITATNIADNAITESKILNNAVTENKIINNAVTESKILNNAVTENKILNSAVTEGKIFNNAVTTDKILNSAVTTGKIANSTILPADLDSTQTFSMRGVTAPGYYTGAALIGSITLGADNQWMEGIYVQGRYAYVVGSQMSIGSTSYLYIVDVNVPSSPVLMSSIATGVDPYSVYVQGRYAYVSIYTDGSLQIFDISNPSSPSLISTTSITNYPYSVYVQGKYAYIGGNNFRVVDVSNPATPIIVGTAAYTIRGIYVKGRYAYTTDGNNTLRIINISNPLSPTSVGSATTGSNPWQVYVQDRYAYVAAATPGLFQIFDVKNPAAPVIVSSVSVGQNPISVYVQDKYAYVGVMSAIPGVVTVDVSNPAAPTVLGSAGGSGNFCVFAQGKYLYVSRPYNMQIFDLGGGYVQQIETGGIETGTLEVRNNATVANDLDVVGGIQAGRSIITRGSLTSYGNIRIPVPTAPPTAASSGTAGEIAWDASYIYVCIATNSWKRAAIAAGW